MAIQHRASAQRIAARIAIALLIISALECAPRGHDPLVPTTRVTAFTNGHWFDGSRFVTRTVYSIDSLLAFERPVRVDTTIDLDGGFVVPPFGEAHNHNVEFISEARTAPLLARYVTEGIFYVQNPNNLLRSRLALGTRINVPGGIDVTFANGGLTSTGGHPDGLYQRNLEAKIYSGNDTANGAGAFLWIIDNASDLAARWPGILAGKPDFIKVFLLHSEEYERRRGDPVYRNWRGLSPEIVSEIVRRAHAAGLRVYAHIETAADFHNALASGVDEIGHLPGFRGDGPDGALPTLAEYEITEADAKIAAARHVPVVTTLTATSLGHGAPDRTLRRRADSLDIRNLKTLAAAGAPIVVGSDNYRSSSIDEIANLERLGIFSNLELLRIWSQATPAAIFPTRRIGKLAPGYEASFLVLSGNPLTDWSNSQRITSRFKQGRSLGR